MGHLKARLIKSYEDPDRYGWVTGMVIGLIATIAIAVVAIAIVRACNKAPVRTHGFLMAGDYTSRFNS